MDLINELSYELASTVSLDAFAPWHFTLQVFYDGQVFTPGKSFLQHMRNPEGPVTFQKIAEVGDKIYGQVDGIPVSLLRTSDRNRWDVAPSQTKKWNLSLEKTYADITSDGIWEWYPSVNFESV